MSESKEFPLNGSSLSLNGGFTNAAFHGDDAIDDVGSKSTFSNIAVSYGTNADKKEPEITSKYPPRTKLNVWKNMTAMGLGFFFLFLAFNALANIQSSLNHDEGLGTANLSIIYIFFISSCLFVPSFMIKKIGCKWTVTIAPLLYSTYVAANFYPSWATLVPTSILVGLTAAPLWSSKATYTINISKEYAFLAGETTETVIAMFFGYFYMFFQGGQIVGNVISSLVLNQGQNLTISDEQFAICGANYCNQKLPYHVIPITNSTSDANIQGSTPDTVKSKLYLLCGIYLGCALFSSVLMAFLLDNLDKSSKKSVSELSGLSLLTATFRQMKNPKQILLIPLTIYVGYQSGFLGGDFTVAMVTCSMGIDKVGYVLVCVFVVDSICSVTFPLVVKKLGRITVFMSATVITIAVAMVILFWKPSSNHLQVIFVLAGIWGMADAVWMPQVLAYYGVIFNDNVEAAYSNQCLWQAIGFVISYSSSSYLCMEYKVYILLSILSIGMIGYYISELLLRKQHDV